VRRSAFSALAGIVIVLSAVAFSASWVIAGEGLTQAMRERVAPLSGVIFDAAAELPDQAPDWLAVEAAARGLAIEAKRLLTHSSVPAVDDAWRSFSKDMAASAEQLARQAAGHDVDACIAESNRLYALCEGCHARYLRQP